MVAIVTQKHTKVDMHTHYFFQVKIEYNKTPDSIRCFVIYKLVTYVWKKPHESCSLDCICKSALILCSESCLLAAKNACMRIEELCKDFSILVVNKLDIVLIKVVLFFHK